MTLRLQYIVRFREVTTFKNKIYSQALQFFVTSYSSLMLFTSEFLALLQPFQSTKYVIEEISIVNEYGKREIV